MLKEIRLQKKSLRKAEEFIQKIHHFRDDAISTNEAPFEKVVIFDEAQRAWDKENLKDFMGRKKGVKNFEMSEPDFLIISSKKSPTSISGR